MIATSGSPLLWLIGVLVILGAVAAFWKHLPGRPRAGSDPHRDLVTPAADREDADREDAAPTAPADDRDAAAAAALTPTAASLDSTGDGNTEDAAPDPDEADRERPQGQVSAPADRPDAEADAAEDRVVLIPAAAARSATELAAAIRWGRREYWVDRWLLGEDAADPLRQVLHRAQQQWAGAVVAADPKATPLGGLIDEIERVATPLGQLRLTRYHASLTTWQGEDEEAVNPHCAAISADRYVSPDPTFGLHRLTAEVGLGLGLARLDIARITASLGSQVGAQLRQLLTAANGEYRRAREALFGAVDDPTEAPAVALAASSGNEQLLDIEASLLYAVWVRRYLELLARQPQELEWARVNDDPAQWVRIARRATRIAALHLDLAGWARPASAAPEQIAELARSLVLLDAHDSARAPMQPRTARSIVAAGEKLRGGLPLMAAEK